MIVAMLFGHATTHRQVGGHELTTGAAAWTQFWQEQGPESRCLSHASPDWHRALSDHWQSFALTLPPAVRVLDIGCGAGVVARSIAAARHDLKAIGIDYARIPSGDHARIEILSATPMETLPFPDSSFGAAVSQFGYEYGQTEEAAQELARVLAAGASFSFLVHHSESPILANSSAHLGALEDLSGARLGASFLSGDAAELDRELSLLRRRHPGERIIEQGARGLRLHVGLSELERAKIWRAVTDALAPGRVLEEALEQCCVAADELDRWLMPLNAMFELRPSSVVQLRGGEPIAWKIEGTRKRRRHA
jgi:SAM-dependent methyltransferase